MSASKKRSTVVKGYKLCTKLYSKLYVKLIYFRSRCFHTRTHGIEVITLTNDDLISDETQLNSRPPHTQTLPPAGRAAHNTTMFQYINNSIQQVTGGE